jgi:DNA polymerase-3 subunit alpha
MSESYQKIGYVSLHNHTTFSISDSLISPKDLIKRTAELGQKAVAVTDHGSLAGLWDAFQEAKKTKVKLIPGIEMYFMDDLNSDTERMRHLILLSKNEVGYRNLLLLTAESFDNKKIVHKKVVPRATWETLEKYKEGLICSTACANGILGSLINEKKYDEAFKTAERLKSIFGDDFAIELQAHALKRKATSYSGEIDQVSTNKRLREIAEKLDVKCIVTTNAHYVHPEQHEAHDVLLAIASGQPINSGQRLKYENVPLHIRDEEDIFTKLSRITYDKEFSKKCIENSKYFADKCEFPEWIDPKYSNPSGKELPHFPVKDQEDYSEFLEWNKENQIEGKQEDHMYLRYRCEIGLKKKVPEEKHQIYKERLESELYVLEHHDFSSYMLIVMDFLEYARKNNMSVGVGRGSAGGVLTCYLVDIHISDPIKYGLIFERFHNIEKASFPDLDCDVASESKEAVENYLIKKYGKDNVANVSNISSLTPKVYMRSIARTFVYGGDRKTAVSIGTNLADAVPADLKEAPIDDIISLPLISEYVKPKEEGGAGYTEVSKYAKDLSKQYAAWSTHAAGLVIGKRPLKGLVPLRKDKDNNIALEFEKERAEANGLVKMDILGLSTLDVIDETRRLIKSLGKEVPKPISEFDYDVYDKKTYDLISEGRTLCVFQLGTSAGTIELCKRIKPKSIEDIAVINSLARPSARDFRDTFIKTRDGELEIKLLHPLLANALNPTYGFPIYEESLMFITKDVANFSLLDSDRCRKITKAKGKDKSKLEALKKDFIDGAAKNGVSEEKAKEIFAFIEGYSAYGFNKSHAIFYSYLGFYTAYLKANYPLEYLVSCLKHEVNSNAKIAEDNIAKIKEEIRAMKVKIVPPDINTSDTSYKIIDSNTLMTGLDAIKFMGKDAMPEILSKRPFSSFEDFLTRIDGSKVRAPAIQALAAAGCLDSLGVSRKMIFLYASDYKKKLGAFLKKKEKSPNKYTEFNYPWPEEPDWTIPEKCALETFYIGEYLAGDRIAAYNGFFMRGSMAFSHLEKLLPRPPESFSESDLKKYNKKVNLLQGEVKSIFEFKVKKEDSKMRGQLMAKIAIEDIYGSQIVLTCFPDGWENLKKKCLKMSGGKQKFDVGCGIYFNGNLSWYNGELGITYEDVVKLCSPPQLPADLKAKKINMRDKSLKEETVVFDEDDRNILLEDIEQELIEMGNSGFEDEDL